MCGRYQLVVDPRTLLETIDAGPWTVPPGTTFEPRWNIAPSEPPRPAGSKASTPRRLTRVPIVRAADDAADTGGDGLRLDDVLWPLVPGWANGEVPKYSTANARSETMGEKPAFRAAWRAGRRCLVLASGFYEWQDTGRGGAKRPWCLEPGNERLFCFGGLWERSRTAGGEELRSCTIVTMAANALMREIHNAGRNRHRMPLMLDAAGREAWLHGSADEARAAIAPYPADEMRATPIGRAINNPNRDAPDVVEPLESA